MRFWRGSFAKSWRVGEIWIRLEAGEFRTNTYILISEEKALIVDPAAPAEEIRRCLGSAEPVGVVLTHPHFDHMLTLEEAREEFKIPLMAAEGAEEFLGDPELNLSLYAGREITAEPPEITLADGDAVGVGALEFQVLLTPGHSPASLCLLEFSERIALTGDLLFAESVGRTDLPGGSEEELTRSLRRLLRLIDDSWLILPGHGPEALLKDVKVYNPLLWEYVRKLKGF